MNKKKKLYLKVLNAMRKFLPLKNDTEAHGMGWAGFPCPHIRIEVYPNSDQATGHRAGGRPCHS